MSKEYWTVWGTYHVCSIHKTLAKAKESARLCEKAGGSKHRITEQICILEDSCENPHGNASFIIRASTRYPELVREVRDIRAINASLLEALLEFERVLRTDAACVTGWDQFQRAMTLMGKALSLCRVRQERA